ncbi:formylglycine-generating enzyme family protein [Glutamicibacter sp. Je.9.36]|uniref:formylglycine-generating enzyme family protein n=1 Tax=Glutamicibacter sp. Je.9.36 TaxID=3142837 RepID=UPI003DA8A4CD
MLEKSDLSLFNYGKRMPFPATAYQAPTWVQVPAGKFVMGSYDFYAEEAPAHEKHVESFQLTRDPVTNAQFAQFVQETGYTTVAERRLNSSQFSDLDFSQRRPGALVFAMTAGPVDLRDRSAWWKWTTGAQWRHPLGEASDLRGKETHPVVQIAYEDALAYAQWIGGRLPTETEFEYASGGGATPSPYAWGEEQKVDGRAMANTWQGRFPYLNEGCEGWVGTSPVGTFPTNSFGLNDLIGNVWEWTSDEFTQSHYTENEAFRAVEKQHIESGYLMNNASTIVRKVLKGGSHLCSPEYSLRYRPAARSPQDEDTATSHIGFRCAR